MPLTALQHSKPALPSSLWPEQTPPHSHCLSEHIIFQVSYYTGSSQGSEFHSWYESPEPNGAQIQNIYCIELQTYLLELILNSQPDEGSSGKWVVLEDDGMCSTIVLLKNGRKLDSMCLDLRDRGLCIVLMQSSLLLLPPSLQNLEIHHRLPNHGIIIPTLDHTFLHQDGPLISTASTSWQSTRII